MAASGAPSTPSRDHSPPITKDKNKIRKPLVEKMRRDRINGSINQLRRILEQEFQLLQPDSRPEKADVLEIAVRFLRQQMCPDNSGNKIFHRSDHLDYNQGYAKCLHETLTYMSIHHVSEETQVKILNHFHQLQMPQRNFSQRPVHSESSRVQPAKHQLLSKSVRSVWRPW